MARIRLLYRVQIERSFGLEEPKNAEEKINGDGEGSGTEQLGGGDTI
jgi:hypothetical protein